MESISEKAGAGPDLKRRRRKPDNQADRLPPHSSESEQGIIGCILLSPNESLRQCQQTFGSSSPFFDLRNDTIYNACVKLGKDLDLITLQQYLKDNGELDQIGGIDYLNACEASVPSTANLPTYLDSVVKKYELRRLIDTCKGVIDRVYSNDGDAPRLLDEAQHDLSRIFQRRQDSASVLGWDDMIAMDTSHDSNCILGYHNGRTTRYLCKGHSAWLIGPSGVGKSSLLFQMGTCFATGKDFHGIAPAYDRRLRVLIIQAENDDGDMAEMAKGIHDGLAMAMEDDLIESARGNIKVMSVDGKIGLQFCAWLRQQIEEFRADILLVDPLLSFAGIDVSRQDQVSQFCRVWLGPVLRETGVVMIAAHHTGKPPRQEGKKPQAQTLTDLAYAGIGSSELVNWARAIMLLQTAGDNLYRLVLAKRGKRAGARHPNGDWTTSIWLKHAEGKIFWEQCEPPVETEKGKSKEGRPSKVDELIAIGLGSVIDQLSTEVGKLELSRRIERYAATKSKDVSLDTCKRAVEKLVENGAVKKTDNGYIKP